MRYYDVIAAIKDNKIDKLLGRLKASVRNSTIDMLRDYYNGNQWLLNGDFTDTARSGRRMWNIKKQKPEDMGVSEGDLQTFNVCGSSVAVYSSYARGNINERNRIVVKDNKELTDQLNDSLNFDVLISRHVTRASTDSYGVWKYTKAAGSNKAEKEEKSAKLKGQGLDYIELIDAKEVFPIYLGEKKVGTIRMYKVSIHAPEVPSKYKGKTDKSTLTYAEIWIPDNKGVMWLYKFIEEEQIDKGKAPYDFDPYIYVPNKDNEFAVLDENSIEVSDIYNLIPIQDTLNKTLTEEGIIISKVAFPMIKVIKEMYEKMADGSIDADKLRADLSKVSLLAGKIISAPIERVDGQDIPHGVDTYINNIFAQIYRITGIPKGVFVSEGMSGISEKTISAMMESLKRRVDEKRANIEEGIKQYVYMMTGSEETMDATTVEWAEMFAMSKAEQAEVVIEGFVNGVLTRDYALEELLHVLGDSERFEEIKAEINEDDFGKKLDTEKATWDAKTQQQLGVKEKDTAKEREARIKAETNATLLGRELKELTSVL
jgi:hypothetical protein